MSFTVRAMTVADLDTVLAIEQTASQAPHWSRAEYERCLAPQQSAPPLRAAFVTESKAGVLGFAIGKIAAGICELESIVVRKEARQQGTGAALLQVVKNWAQASGAARLELEVRASNIAAIRLYERAGMRVEGIRKGYYPHPEEDALLMGVSLPSGGKLL